MPRLIHQTCNYIRYAVVATQTSLMKWNEVEQKTKSALKQKV